MKLSILFASVLALSVTMGHADSLEDLQASPEYKGAVRSHYRLQLPPWVNPESNYVKLFEGTSKSAPVVQLLGDEYEGFTLLSSRLIKKDSFISAYRSFGVFNSKKPISVSLVIPHPAMIQLAHENLVMEIEALKPKAATILSVDPISIQSDPAQLILLKDGTTIVLIPLPMESFIIASAETAKDAKEMKRLLEMINVGEIKRRLTS